MNKIVLIGNGFDLAHEMKTSYSDFIFWCFQEAENAAAINQGIYNGNLFSIKYGHNYPGDKEFLSIKKLINFYSTNGIIIKYKNPFFERIVKTVKEFNWVNIESEYYNSLINFYNFYESSHERRRASIIVDVEKLNKGLSDIKNSLIEYLSILEKENQKENQAIRGHFINMTTFPNFSTQTDKLLVINFNYTTTITKYINENFNYNRIINIHGRLNDSANPIIFGYGDEKDIFYEKIERLNINAFLNGFKSFYYSQTSNYQDISRFLEDGKYNVSIMGHSCGLSDRVLLNSIFENINCTGIELFYHKRSDGSSDYFERTQEISRHFSPEGKNTMRNIIKPYSSSKPLSKTDS